MKQLPKPHKSEWGMIAANPDPDFDPIRNQKVIDGVIKKMEKNRKRIMAEFDETVKERTEAGAIFIKNLERGGGQSDARKYFGPKYMAYLRGEHIISELKKNITLRDGNGKVIKRAGELDYAQKRS